MAVWAGCAGDIGKYCSHTSGSTLRYCLLSNAAHLSAQCKESATATETTSLKRTLGTPYCYRSPVCDPPAERGGDRLGVKAVEWKQTMGYTFAYPIASPEGEKYGMVAVATDSKDNLWGLQRNPEGRPQLFKWDSKGKLLLTIGDNVITHHAKAHGIAVDAQDNLWITDAAGATAKKISPDGKLLMTIGARGHRGDWDEPRGQRLLWEPLMVGFGPKGDIYIAQGHGHESPNDTNGSDPTNNSGAARILRLDKNGKFIQQWWGNAVGQGKFVMAHGFAVDPKSGDVYIGDREDYRIVVYTGDGVFSTMQTRNLICALNFDRQGNLWMASGWDGQFLEAEQAERPGAGRDRQWQWHGPGAIPGSVLFRHRQPRQGLRPATSAAASSPRWCRRRREAARVVRARGRSRERRTNGRFCLNDFNCNHRKS